MIKSSQFIKSIRGTDEIISDGVPQIAFVGRSNVGKSSLINAIVDKKALVRVGKKPGKTKEINFFLTNGTFYLVDLPGYGYAQATPKEREKLKKLIVWYLSESGAKPVLVVLVLDVKAGLTSFDEDMIGILRTEKHPFIIVVNKIDKLKQGEQAQQMAAIRKVSGDAGILAASAQTSRGIPEVLEALNSALQ